MTAVIVKLECMTNMHVGNGDVNYNIIDNEVERDPVTGYPNINASGVKGALREYFSKDTNLSGYVNRLFGSDEKGNTTQGQLKILGADMMALAVRASCGDEPYYLVTTEAALNKYRDNCSVFLGITEPITEKAVEGQRMVEGIALTKAVTLFDKELHIMTQKDFRRLALPVVARNKLDNGISRNLWYEEVVPHESIFCFAVMGDKEDLKDFSAGIDGKVIQFGGSASIGYGLCKVSVTEAEQE